MLISNEDHLLGQKPSNGLKTKEAEEYKKKNQLQAKARPKDYLETHVSYVGKTLHLYSKALVESLMTNNISKYCASPHNNPQKRQINLWNKTFLWHVYH